MIFWLKWLFLLGTAIYKQSPNILTMSKVFSIAVLGNYTSLLWMLSLHKNLKLLGVLYTMWKVGFGLLEEISIELSQIYSCWMKELLYFRNLFTEIDSFLISHQKLSYLRTCLVQMKNFFFRNLNDGENLWTKKWSNRDSEIMFLTITWALQYKQNLIIFPA